jgi:hypothetical protein
MQNYEDIIRLPSLKPAPIHDNTPVPHHLMLGCL